MRIGEALFIIWTVLVGLWWIQASPESAPQQAALAGQVLVLVFLPYAVLATVQRGRKKSFEINRTIIPKETDTGE